ncbi:MAG: acyltransferase [Deltaproteobacteria bacterium]|nr:acyltransferase [Deltaproteobacteria bacterium]
MQTRGIREHVLALDGLRGVAAIVVLNNHSVGSIVGGGEFLAAIKQTPLIALFNPKVAVEIFFVLSGFVLAGSLMRHTRLAELPQFYIRRIFRIHPPYVMALMFAWCASFAWGPLREGVSSFAVILAKVHIPFSELLGYLLFPGSAGNQLSIGWTLEIEMIFSLLLPIMFLLARRTHWALLIALCIIPLLIGPYGHRVLKFGIDFAFGIALFLERERLSMWLGKIKAPGALLWFAIWLAVANTPLFLNWPYLFEGGSPGSIFLQSVGSAGLVAGTAFIPAISRVFSTAPCVYLGKISYSIYLLHFSVVLLLASISVAGTDLYVLTGAYVITIPLAGFTYRFVERPAIAAGSRLCKVLAQRFGGEVIAARAEEAAPRL